MWGLKCEMGFAVESFDAQLKEYLLLQEDSKRIKIKKIIRLCTIENMAW